MIAVAPRQLVSAVGLVVAGAARAAPLPERGFGLPRDVSLDGHRVDSLIHFTIIATAIIFLLAAAVLVVAVIRHGRGHAAVYNPGSKASIALVAGFVGLVALVVDGNLFVHTIVDMEHYFWNFAAAEERPDTIRIEVQAHQWAWAVRYAGPDGKFNTPDDIVTLNDLRVPVGTPVLVQLSSVDVIHSMYLPNLRVKRDAVPGEITKLTFQARQPGEFEIACAQHCGPNHYKMRGVLTVLSPDRYAEWLRVAAADAHRGYDPDDAEAHWGWEWRRE